MTDPRPAPSYDPAPAIEYDYSLNLSWLNRALYYSAGVDVQLLKHCPNYDRVKLQGIGGTVMATAVLALLPPAAVVLLMQKWFIKGLVDTEK
jgi:hypothetical protein